MPELNVVGLGVTEVVGVTQLVGVTKVYVVGGTELVCIPQAIQ